MKKSELLEKIKELEREIERLKREVQYLETTKAHTTNRYHLEPPDLILEMP